MTILVRSMSRAMHAAWAPPGPLDDWSQWQSAPGTVWLSQAGLAVTPATALTVSTIWACTRVIGETMASIPLVLYERRENETKRRATEQPLYRILHDDPNTHQTSMMWREMLTGHTCLRGNGLSEIRKERGEIVELVPLHPDRVKLDVTERGTLRYVVKGDNGQDQPALLEDEVFHLRGPSDNGLTGMSVVGVARDSIGLTQAAESHGNRTFRNGASLSGVLQHPGRLSPEAAKRIRESWDETYAGVSNAGRTAVLWEDMKWQAVGMASKDAEWLATRQFQVEESARWFRMPLHMIGHTEKQTTWGTGIEQMTIGFVIYTMLPWARRWEQQIAKSLILRPERFFAEFLFDGLLRGDIKTRYEAYAVAVQWGWMTRNEIRRLENMDPLPGLDEAMTPMNMALGNPPRPLAPAAALKALLSGEAVPVIPDTAESHELLQVLSRDAAARLVRKEIAAVSRSARKYADDADGWSRWLTGFYDALADELARTLHVPERAARSYAKEQRAAIERDGVGVVEGWEPWRADHLVGLMTGAAA